MNDKETFAPGFHPPRSEAAFENARQTIEHELEMIAELLGTGPEQPERVPVWNILGAMNAMATELRRIRIKLEESRAVAPGSAAE